MNQLTNCLTNAASSGLLGIALALPISGIVCSNENDFFKSIAATTAVAGIVFALFGGLSTFFGGAASAGALLGFYLGFNKVANSYWKEDEKTLAKKITIVASFTLVGAAIIHVIGDVFTNLPPMSPVFLIRI